MTFRRYSTCWLGAALSSVLLIPALTAAANKKEPRRYELPLLDIGGRPGVVATLPNSRIPIHFVVDTAAGASVIDQAMAKQLGLIDGNKTSKTIHGASGDTSGVSMVTMRGLKVGELSISLMQALSSNLNYGSENKLDGILGNGLLGLFDVKIDMPAGKLELSDPIPSNRFDGPTCQANAGGTDRPPGLKGFSFINVGLAAKDPTAAAVSARATIDSGAPRTIINWAAAHAMGLVLGDAAFKAKGKPIRGFDTKLKTETDRYELSSLRIGPWQSGPVEVEVADLPVFKTLGLDKQPALILGTNILRQKPLSISKGAQRICFG